MRSAKTDKLPAPAFEHFGQVNRVPELSADGKQRAFRISDRPFAGQATVAITGGDVDCAEVGFCNSSRGARAEDSESRRGLPAPFVDAVVATGMVHFWACGSVPKKQASEQNQRSPSATPFTHLQ